MASALLRALALSILVALLALMSLLLIVLALLALAGLTRTVLIHLLLVGVFGLPLVWGVLASHYESPHGDELRRAGEYRQPGIRRMCAQEARVFTKVFLASGMTAHCGTAKTVD
jgi:hypothetical protein